MAGPIVRRVRWQVVCTLALWGAILVLAALVFSLRADIRNARSEIDRILHVAPVVDEGTNDYGKPR